MKNINTEIIASEKLKGECIALNSSNGIPSHYNNADILLDRDIEDVTASLQTQYSKCLRSIKDGNAMIVTNYIKAMRTETNLSDNYRKDVIKVLCIFSNYNKDKPFNVITRRDIIAFLDSFRRPDALDPMHKWIGTYNIYKIHLIRFFKWLYFPDVEPGNRPKSEL